MKTCDKCGNELVPAMSRHKGILFCPKCFIEYDPVTFSPLN